MSSALLWCFTTRHSTQAMAIVLVKCCNAVAEHHSNARRVGLSVPMAALHLLQRTMAIHCEARLALDPDRPTESINTTLSEYWAWREHENHVCFQYTLQLFFTRTRVRLNAATVYHICRHLQSQHVLNEDKA